MKVKAQFEGYVTEESLSDYVIGISQSPVKTEKKADESIVDIMRTREHCIFCGRKAFSKQSNGIHMSKCHNNPNRTY